MTVGLHMMFMRFRCKNCKAKNIPSTVITRIIPIINNVNLNAPLLKISLRAASSKSCMNSFKIFWVTVSTVKDRKPCWYSISDCQTVDCWVNSVRSVFDISQSRGFDGWGVPAANWSFVLTVGVGANTGVPPWVFAGIGSRNGFFFMHMRAIACSQ